jgi:imidazolonepropionase-like amidohydrolase
MNKRFTVIGWFAMAVAALLTLACGHQRTTIRSGIAFELVTLVDVVQARTLSDMTVVADGTKVVAVQPASSLAHGDPVVRVDGTGKYLIPGL